MRKHLWRTALLCAVLAALVTASSRSPAPTGPAVTDTGHPEIVLPETALSEAVLSDAALSDPPLILCLACYDARGRFLGLEITDGVTLNPDTGDTVLPIRNIPRGAAKMRVFLFDESLRVMAPVTEGNF